MARILIAGRIDPAGLDLLNAAPDVTIDYVDDAAPDAYISHLPDADAVLLRTQPMTAQTIATATKLKIVSRHGVGYDTVDVEALNQRGIPLAIVGDVNSSAVAEHAVALMIACAKRLIWHHDAVRSGDWNLRNEFSATELGGKVLLIVGFGRIGQKVGAIATAFGMRVMAHDLFQDAQAIAAAGATPVENLADGLREADFVTLHIPLTGPEPVIGAAELALMKSSAILVSTARGGLIDEHALAAALKGGRLGGAGLDVLSSEPPPPNQPLLAADGVILSPHIAGLTTEGGQRLAIGAAGNILDFFAGKLDPSLVVNAKQINFAS